MSATPKILNEMFGRLLGIQVGPQVTDRLSPVIDGVIEKVHANLDLDTVQGQNTFRALVCSMVVKRQAIAGACGARLPNTALQNISADAKKHAC